MASIDFGTIDLYAGVTEDCRFTITLYDADGVSPAALVLADVVHCVLSERVENEPDTEVLAVSSSAETALESRIYVTDLGDAIAEEPAVGYVRFSQGDLDAIVDAWDAEDDPPRSKRLILEMWYVDSAEANPASAKKLFLRGIAHLHRSAAQ